MARQDGRAVNAHTAGLTDAARLVALAADQDTDIIDTAIEISFDPERALGALIALAELAELGLRVALAPVPNVDRTIDRLLAVYSAPP
jgi:hypothetical protein